MIRITEHPTYNPYVVHVDMASSAVNPPILHVQYTMTRAQIDAFKKAWIDQLHSLGHNSALILEPNEGI